MVGAVPRSLPPFHLPSWDAADQLGQLASGALAIALLGLVEAVSIAKSISNQTRQRLNINREFVGQGLADLSAAFFSGYPVSGSFTRSAVNFRSGARTPLSGVLSGLAVAATVLAAAPLAGVLPVAGLAGVLVVVAYEMIDWKDIKRTIRATRGDAAVLVVTLFCHAAAEHRIRRLRGGPAVHRIASGQNLPPADLRGNPGLPDREDETRRLRGQFPAAGYRLYRGIDFFRGPRPSSRRTCCGGCAIIPIPSTC